MGERQKSPLGIFWDIENCAIPRNKSASDVAKRIRDFIQDRHPECGYAKEFFIACDIKRMDAYVCEALDRNGVVVVHVNSSAKNAADDKLQELIDMFVDKFGADSVLVVITGDINFAKPIRNALRKDITVVLIHGTNHSRDLKNLVNESYLFEDVIKDCETITKTEKQLNPGFLKVSNVPKDKPNAAISSRLSQLSANCGGKVEEVVSGEAVIRFGCIDDALRAQQRMAGEDCLGLKIDVKLVDSMTKLSVKGSTGDTNATLGKSEVVVKSKVVSDGKVTQNKSTSGDECKSVIKGLAFTSGDKVIQMVRQMTNKWKDSQINGNLIANVEERDNQLIVTAVSAEANQKLLSSAKQHLRPEEGVEWQPLKKRHKLKTQNSVQNIPDLIINKLKTKSSNDENKSTPASDDCKSVIKGLFTKKDEDVIQTVRKLVSDWKESHINPNFVSFVSRGSKVDGKANLFVTTTSAQHNHILFMAAKRHLNDSEGIKWLKFTPKPDAKVTESLLPKGPKTPDKTQPNPLPPEDNTCKSVIKGMETKINDNVTQMVRKLVKSWSDTAVKSNLVVDVKRDVKFAQKDGKALLFVVAVNPEGSIALVNGAKKHLKPVSGLKWGHFKPKQRHDSVGTESNASDSLNHKKSLFASNDCKSLIVGLETKKDQSVAKVVRKLVMEWKDGTIHGNLITQVERCPGFENEDGSPPLLVTAFSAETNLALLVAAQQYLKGSKIIWTPFMG